jgi:hypothetical protein
MIDNPNFYLQFKAKPIWNIVIELRSKLRDLDDLKGFSEENIESIETVIMELFENAVKYGLSTKDAEEVTLELSFCEENELKISVSNGIESIESIKSFLEIIQKIQNTEDLESLYIERLNEIAENPKSGKSQLGLFRICYESGFNLDYKISGNKLTIDSTKTMEKLT